MATKVYEFSVEMTCEGCSGAVDRVLSKLKGNGVEEVIIDLPAKRVTVKSTLEPNVLLDTIKKTGKETSYIGVKS